MKHVRLVRYLSAVIALTGSLALAARKDQGPEPTEKLTYKEIAGLKLELWMWKPVDWKATDKRGAIVFYHGGGWRSGGPPAFARQSAKLAEDGMVAFSVQYRLLSQDGVKIDDCVKDAKSAFRWVRVHAAELGIDPEKIAAGGGSAGGHLAAALSTLDEINDPADDLKVSTRPVALVLFNPAANLDFPKALEGKTEEQKKELFVLSPYHHLKAGQPPTIIFHGDADHHGADSNRSGLRGEDEGTRRIMRGLHICRAKPCIFQQGAVCVGHAQVGRGVLAEAEIVEVRGKAPRGGAGFNRGFHGFCG
jgi:predicted alpha/beta-hydrolase family hydrolase